MKIHDELSGNILNTRRTGPGDPPRTTGGSHLTSFGFPALSKHRTVSYAF